MDTVANVIRKREKPPGRKTRGFVAFVCSGGRVFHIREEPEWLVVRSDAPGPNTARAIKKSPPDDALGKRDIRR
jgi:hypothetical protein